ncbi:MAG TPA: FtsQ-type POTRA domain-containing protein, partial [bacterium]|nr:FtsQ-type POTRA domain-containing protein [bacterium]
MNRRRPWSAPVARKKVRKILLPSRARMAKSWEEIRAALAWSRIPIPHLNRRAMIFAGAGLVMAMGLYVCRGKITALLNHPRLQVRSIAVVGNRYADSDEILKLCGLRPGQSWVLLDAGAIRRRARVHPWVDDVVVERPWLGKVKLKVRESV